MTEQVTWKCPKCGATITASSNAELGMEVAAHLEGHK